MVCYFGDREDGHAWLVTLPLNHTSCDSQGLWHCGDNLSTEIPLILVLIVPIHSLLSSLRPPPVLLLPPWYLSYVEYEEFGWYLQVLVLCLSVCSSVCPSVLLFVFMSSFSFITSITSFVKFSFLDFFSCSIISLIKVHFFLLLIFSIESNLSWCLLHSFHLL